MVTPPKGDYASLPINDAAKKVADAWDPEKDQKDGNACKAYGGAAIMRMPTRLHITWQDDSALKIEADAGTQTRILRFGDSAIAEPSWQGRSKASWEFLGNVAVARGGGGQGANGGGGGGGGAAANAAAAPRYGSLKVVTDRLKPGYLRKNGVPYSENAIVTEYFD